VHARTGAGGAAGIRALRLSLRACFSPGRPGDLKNGYPR
jgi:hypothetical protein